MKKLLFAFFLTVFINDTSAQSSCGLTWLKEQRSASFSKPPWDDYIGPRVRKLFQSDYFTLQSDRDYAITVDMQSGEHYTILYYTGQDALASGLELRDASGLRIEFEKVYGKSVNNWLEVKYEAARNGKYSVVIRSLFPSDHSSCAALLVREYDDDEWKEYAKSEDEPLSAD